jgi:hypothetical protein
VVTSRREIGAGGWHIGEERNAYRVLLGRPEGKRPLENPRHRWDDNITYILRRGVDRVHLSEYRSKWWVVNEHINALSGYIECGKNFLRI